MSTKDKTQQQLQSELDEINRKYQSLKLENDSKQKECQAELDEIKRKYQALEREHEALKQKELQQKTETKHPEAFWNEIRGKCYKHDTQYIISLIDNKTLSVNDVGAGGETLLHYAAVCGAYEIVQLCISLGADITLQNNIGHTALDYADDEGHHAIKQLLHFAAMKANTGERIREKADGLSEQSGIVENI
eukprot:468296_1